MSDLTHDDFVVSFKPHGGYDAPLVAIKGANAASIDDKINAAIVGGLFARVAQADQAFKAAFNAGAQLGATPAEAPTAAQYPPATPTAPQAPAQAGPGGIPVKTCPHGTKVYRTSAPNAQKSWAGWFCPTPKGTPGQCPVEWA